MKQFNLAFVIVALTWLAYSALTARSESTYRAWCAAHPTYHLSFDEWKQLYDAEMLPGQNKIHRTQRIP